MSSPAGQPRVPDRVLADKVCSSKAIRTYLRSPNAATSTPTALVAARRAVAARHDKTALSCQAMIDLATLWP